MNEATLDGLTSLLEVPHWAKVLVYGPPGCGKTVMAANGPPSVHMDADGTGTLALLNHPELISRVRLMRGVTITKAIDVFEAKMANHPKMAWCETITIDTLDALAGINLNEIIKRDTVKHENRDQIGAQRDYKFNTADMRRLIELVVAVPCNVVVVAHDEEIRDDTTGAISHGPYLSKAIRAFAEQKFDVFGYMTSNTDIAGNVTRQMQLQGNGRIKAKTRIGGLPAVLADPSLNVLIAAKAWMIQNAHLFVQAEYEQWQQQMAQVTPVTPEPELVPTAVTDDGSPAFTLGAAFIPEETNV